MTTLYVAVGGTLGVLARFGIGRLTLHHESLEHGRDQRRRVVPARPTRGGDWFGRDLGEGIGVGSLAVSRRSRDQIYRLVEQRQRWGVTVLVALALPWRQALLSAPNFSSDMS